MASGVGKDHDNHKLDKTYWKVFDRREAIRKAIGLAGDNDIITVTGKGAETAMVWGSEHRPWSDKRVIEEELQQYIMKYEL